MKRVIDDYVHGRVPVIIVIEYKMGSKVYMVIAKKGTNNEHIAFVTNIRFDDP